MVDGNLYLHDGPDGKTPQLQSEKEHGDNDKQVPSTLSQAQPVQTQQQLLSLPEEQFTSQLNAAHTLSNSCPALQLQPVQKQPVQVLQEPLPPPARKSADMKQNQRIVDRALQPVDHGQPDSMPIKCEFSDLVKVGGDPEFRRFRHSRATSYMKSLVEKELANAVAYVVKLKKGSFSPCAKRRACWRQSTLRKLDIWFFCRCSMSTGLMILTG